MDRETPLEPAGWLAAGWLGGKYSPRGGGLGRNGRERPGGGAIRFVSQNMNNETHATEKHMTRLMANLNRLINNH